MTAAKVTVVKLSAAQRRVLRALVAAGGSKLMTPDVPRVTVNKLVELGFVTVKPGGTTSKCPRSGVDVFTPGPATATITGAGREAEQLDRATESGS